jgi:hypothetical protein
VRRFARRQRRDSIGEQRTERDATIWRIESLERARECAR